MKIKNKLIILVVGIITFIAVYVFLILFRINTIIVMPILFITDLIIVIKTLEAKITKRWFLWLILLILHSFLFSTIIVVGFMMQLNLGTEQYMTENVWMYQLNWFGLLVSIWLGSILAGSIVGKLLKKSEINPSQNPV